MNHWEMRKPPDVKYEQAFAYQNQRRRPTVMPEREEEVTPESLIVYCIKRRCGEPVPFTRRMQKREMDFVGFDWLGDAIYLCCECGGHRSFGLTLDGTIKETTWDGLTTRGARRLLRPMFGVS
ncbi:MAG: hypothetical protein JNK38_00820 [Acidobacteria bacterium]|nr:hypothetical protein [Acidobacteriota bacterium]